MMQWIRSAPVALFGARPAPVTPFAPVLAVQPCARAAHAEMLANAAARRRRAQGEDAMYWRAVAPLALARARALRMDGALPKLP